MSALSERLPFSSTAASVQTRVAMFEPHPAGHAHMRYSAPLVEGLAQVCPEGRFTLLVSPEGADARTTISGVEVERAIRVPLPLERYRSRLAGILDRCAHWGPADRQIAAWVRAHPDVRLVHYQDSYGLATLQS